MEQMLFVAVGPDGTRREWPLDDKEYQVGRADGQQRENWLAVEGDPHLSRQHFSVRVQAGKLQVRRYPSSRNPLFCGGRESEFFELNPGQFFTTGKSQFGLRTQQPSSEMTLFGQSKERARLRRLEDCFAAVVQVLERLRRDPSGGAPWRPAFAVIQGLLPSVERLVFIELQGTQQRIVDEQRFSDTSFELPGDLLRKALERNSTVTVLSDSPVEGSDVTVGASSQWVVVAPMRCLESSAYALGAFGSDILDAEALEEVAAIIDVVADLVGHHLLVQQAAEYSNLLGVFGHHVGTLFKTSGALKLWGDPQQPAEVRQVLDNLLPIWGVSQAISLHKKQGELDSGTLPPEWIAPRWKSRCEVAQAAVTCLESLVAYVYQGEAPYLPWLLQGHAVARLPFLSLPPLSDNPMVFDKTLALTIGLIEMLNNLRKYPEARGSGREDRRELAQLNEEERTVRITCWADSQQAVLEVIQPVVSTGEGCIPQSRSLHRIRALETRLLRGLVQTGLAEPIGPTSEPHILRVRQRWTYFFGRLVSDD